MLPRSWGHSSIAVQLHVSDLTCFLRGITESYADEVLPVTRCSIEYRAQR